MSCHVEKWGDSPSLLPNRTILFYRKGFRAGLGFKFSVLLLALLAPLPQQLLFHFPDKEQQMASKPASLSCPRRARTRRKGSQYLSYRPPKYQKIPHAVVPRSFPGFQSFQSISFWSVARSSLRLSDRPARCRA